MAEFREIPVAEVPHAQRRVAELALGVVAPQLGLSASAITLRWFREVNYYDGKERRAWGFDPRRTFTGYDRMHGCVRHMV